MAKRTEKLLSKSMKATLHELPYFNFKGDLAAYHGRFHNICCDIYPTK